MIRYARLGIAVTIIHCFAVFAATRQSCLREDFNAAVCPNQQYNTIPGNFSKNISILALPRNNISSLNVNSTLLYPEVTLLDLDYNVIQSTNDIEAVRYFTKLRKLYISANNLLTLNFQVFTKNYYLQEIIADDNPNVQLNHPVGLWNLRRLSLKHNKVRYLSRGAFKHFYALEVLDLRDNELQSLPPSLKYTLANLKHLFISFNPIVYLEPDLYYISDTNPKNTVNRIKTLKEVKSNSVTKTYYKGFCSFTNTIGHCIDTIKLNTLGQVELEIKILYLPKSDISTLNTWKLAYPNLVELNLNDNKIESTSDMLGISTLINLRIIYLSGNGLLKLDFRIFSRNNFLEEVYADRNPNITISSKPVRLPKLRIISLKNNNLTSLSLNTYSRFSGLELLDLRNNELKYLPEYISYVFPNLTQLLLDNNPIAAIDVNLNPVIDLQADYILEDPKEKVTTELFLASTESTLDSIWNRTAASPVTQTVSLEMDSATTSVRGYTSNDLQWSTSLANQTITVKQDEVATISATTANDLYLNEFGTTMELRSEEVYMIFPVLIILVGTVLCGFYCVGKMKHIWLYTKYTAVSVDDT